MRSRGESSAPLLMSLAGGGSSSRAASSRPSPEMADGGEGEGRSQPPPDTISKTKVKWTWQHFDRTNVGAVRRSLTLDVHDANQVKGDDGAEDTPMTEKEASARTEQAAHEGGLQEDLLWANDVRDEEQQRAVDRFLTDCVQVSEDVTLQQGTFSAIPSSGGFGGRGPVVRADVWGCECCGAGGRVHGEQQARTTA